MKNFEERLRRLEELSEKIREPDLALEDAVAAFEEGVKLSKGLRITSYNVCYTKLLRPVVEPSVYPRAR